MLKNIIIITMAVVGTAVYTGISTQGIVKNDFEAASNLERNETINYKAITGDNPFILQEKIVTDGEGRVILEKYSSVNNFPNE